MQNIYDCRFRHDDPLKLQISGRCFAKAYEHLSLPNLAFTAGGDPACDPDNPIHLKAFIDYYLEYRRVMPAVHAIEREREDNELINFLSFPTSWVENVSDGDRKGYDVSLFEDNERNDMLSGNRLSLDVGFTRRLYWLMTKLHECPLASRRTLWTTQSEHRTDVAWLPPSTKPGDNICAFAGSPWPFVIRPAQHESYKFIGDGHVHSTPLIEALGGVYNPDDPDHDFRRGEPLGLNICYLKLVKLVKQLGWIVLS